MSRIGLSIVCCVLLGACGSEEQSYGEIPRETLDEVSQDVEAAAAQSKEKIDEALKRLE